MRILCTYMVVSKFIHTVLVILIIAISFTGSSCSNDNSANFKVVHFSPDIDSIDVYNREDIIFKSVSYAESTQYISLSTDTGRSHEIKVTPSNSFTILVDQNRTFAKDKEYTLFVFGFGENASSIFQLDDNTKTVSNRARIRFVHASPSTKNVDVYITSPNDSLNDVTPSIESTSFKRISTYMESIEDDYRIRVTERDNPSVLIADTGIISLQGNRVYTAALIDNYGGGAPFEIAVYVDK